MRNWIVVPLAVLYALFDYVWFNVVIRSGTPCRKVQGRVVQLLVFLGAAGLLLYERAYTGLAIWLLWQWFWVYDALYYLWAWLLDVTKWENRWTVIHLVHRAYVPHAWWTPAAWWKGGRPNAEDLAIQVSVAVAMGIGVLLAETAVLLVRQ
jgi:hypothetical protein